MNQTETNYETEQHRGRCYEHYQNLNECVN